MILGPVLATFALGSVFVTEAGFGGREEVTESPEQSAIRRRMASDRVRMRYLRKEESSILGAFRSIERGIEEKGRRQKRLAEKESRLEARIRKTDDELRANDARLAHLKEGAGRRAVAMQRLSKTSLEILVRRAVGMDHADGRRVADALRRVLAYDAGLLDKVRDARRTAEVLRQELDGERGDLASAKKALSDEVDAALLLREEQSALLDAIRTERKASERLARELVEQARRQEREASLVHGEGPQPDAVPGGFESQKGHLPWPVAGRVAVPFGKKVDARSGIVLFQRGLGLVVPLGSPVRSVFAGRVVFSARLKGYSDVVVVDHGGWMTVYGHLERRRVEKGAAVQQHEVVGFAGGGSSGDAQLYFEVRRGREAVDPQAWLTH